MSLPSARGPAVRGASPFAVVLALLLLAGACHSRSNLLGTLDSPADVARAVVDRLARRDLTGLRALAVSEDEFRVLVWPRQPAARPGRNIPWDFAWKDLRAKSEMQLAGRVREWTDRGFEVMQVGFEGETTDYETYRIHRKSVVALRDRDGQETRTRLFGSMIERGGRYKVFSYVVD